MRNNITGNGIVSVIIPVYQVERYVRRCILSVIGQTYKKLEIIVVDDGSRDGSLEICKKLAEEDPRIRVFHQENLGVAVARNKGIDHAIGQFICFLDSDDWIDENMLTTMVSLLERQHTDLCICGFKYIDDTHESECSLSDDHQVGRDEFMEKHFWRLYKNAILFNIGTKLYKRSLIEENNMRFRTDMCIYEDINFCLDYLDKAKRISLCGKSFYYYFQGNANAVTNGYKENFWNSTLLYCNILLKKFDNSLDPLKEALLICLYRAYLQECHNPDITKTYLLNILKADCYPMVKNLRLGNSRTLKLSIDQCIFIKLVERKAWKVFWWLAKVISMKKSRR